MNIQEMLIIDEGLRLKAYECTAGKVTIGVGRNLDDKGISREEAMMMLDSDIKEFQAALANDSDVGEIFQSLDDVRKQALINMAFNMGLGSLKGFKNMWRALRIKDFKEAAIQAKDSRWYHQVKSRGNRICDVIENGNLDSYKR
jgi:lysozyme